MLSTVSAGRVHVGLSTNRSWSQRGTQPARLPLPAGRFGCRADCGRLQDIQNLTAIRIDLDYDFSHPSGSIPATASVWVAGAAAGQSNPVPCAVASSTGGKPALLALTLSAGADAAGLLEPVPCWR